jgi:beta-lactam-binding protein with PASTA domain
MAIKGSVKRTFRFNLAVVLLLCGTIYILFFASLRWITRHGEEITIPSEWGRNVSQAVADMKNMGFDVYLDSIYDPRQKPFIVLAQIPDSGSIVKKGRTVFLTINKILPPGTPMPNLVSLSYRSAEMILKNNNLFLGDTTMKPDIAQGAVLAQLWNGSEIKPGDVVPQGSRISLVIGDGLGNTQIGVPDVIGLSVDEGVNNLIGSGLQYVMVIDGAITDTATAIIYNQTPKAINDVGGTARIKAGDVINLYIKQNATAEEIQTNKKTPKFGDEPRQAPVDDNNQGSQDVNNSSGQTDPQ